jgi:hypothetical protein
MTGGSHNSVSHCLGVDSFSFPFSGSARPEQHATLASDFRRATHPSSHFRRRRPAAAHPQARRTPAGSQARRALGLRARLRLRGRASLSPSASCRRPSRSLRPSSEPRTALRVLCCLLVPARTPLAGRTLAPSLGGRTLGFFSFSSSSRVRCCCWLRRAAAGCCWLLLLRRVKNSAARLLQFQFQSPLAPSPAVLLLGFFGCLLRFTYCCCLLLPVICSWLPADSDFSDSIVAV